MRRIGYVLSGCDQNRISFVVMEDAEVYVNGYYFINHPLSPTGEFNPVLLRVHKITPYNPEMTVGSFGPIAGKKGEKAYYGKKLEYLVAWAEVLGYISWDGKWRKLECSPNTWDSVYEPSQEELKGIFLKLSGKRLLDRADFPVRIGRHRGLDMPFYLDLNAIAKGHMFVAGMSVEYGEPLIYMAHGRIHIEKIGEFVDRFFSDDSEGSVKVDDVYVPSFDPETYKISWRPVAEVIRHRYRGFLIKLTVETGRSVTVTPDHSVFVLRGCRVLTVPASEIKVGDYLVAPSKIPLWQRPVSEIDVSEILLSAGYHEEGYLHNVPDSVYERLDQKGLWLEEDSSKRLIWRRRGVLPVRYSRFLTPEEKERTVLVAGRSIGVPTLIRLDKEFARLLGYYVAKGSVVIDDHGGYKVIFDLGLDDVDTVEDIRRIIGRIASKNTIRVLKRGSSCRVIVYDRVLAILLKSLAPGEVNDRRVPWVILNSTAGVVEEFLKAWLDGGSGVTASEWLASDIQYLFLTLNVLASFYGSKAENGTPPGGERHNSAFQYTLKPPSLELAGFGGKLDNHKLVPVSCLPDILKNFNNGSSRCRVTKKVLRRIERLAECLELVSKGDVQVESKTFMGKFYRLLQDSGFIEKRDGSIVLTDKGLMLLEAINELNKLSESDLSFMKVTRIEKVKSNHKFVYDISVPGCENFVAGFGGVFCHNTRSGKSTFVLNLMARALEQEPKPRFIVFDRRSEYSLLTNYGAVMLPYYRFVPKAELISPELITSRLGLDPRRSDGKILCEALYSIRAEGLELTAKNILKKCVEISPYLLTRGRESVLAKIRWVLEKRGEQVFATEHKPLSIIDMVYQNPAVIVDFSVDANIEDQQLAAKYIIRNVMNYAVEHRKSGDFAVIFVIEEAQYFIPERGLKIEVGNPEKTGVDKQIIEAISQAGGYNVGFILVTQRPAYVSKCLSGDMAVQLYNGDVVTVRRLFEELKDEGGFIVETDGEMVVYPRKDLYLSTLDRNLNRISTKLIAISKRKGLRKILRIKTYDGYILECSPEHRVYLIDGYGNLTEKEAGSLKPGEQLILVHPITQPANLDLGPVMKDVGITFHEPLRRREALNTALKPYGGDWNEATDIPCFEIRNRVQEVQRTLDHGMKPDQIGVYTGRNALSVAITPVKVPSGVTPDLGELLGLMVSERCDVLSGPSCTLRFTNKNRFRGLSEALFGAAPKRSFGAYGFRLRSKNLVEALEALGCKLLIKARDREVPLCVQRSSDDVVAAFLRGLFEGNGYISMKNGIGFTTTSRTLAYQALFLLFRLGFKPRFKIKSIRYGGKTVDMFEVYLLDKNSILMFKQKIGFISSDKRVKLEKLVSMARSKRSQRKYDYAPLSPDLLRNAIMEIYSRPKYNYLWSDVIKCRRKLTMYRLRKICEAIEGGSGDGCPSLRALKRIAAAPISFSTIKEIEEFQVDETYDLETESQSLVAGGAPFLVHNSVISQCNTIATFRLMAGNDQEAIVKYSEYGNERMADYLPGLADHEALIWGMASPVPFPVTVEIDVKDYPAKTSVVAKVAWEKMGSKSCSTEDRVREVA